MSENFRKNSLRFKTAGEKSEMSGKKQEKLLNIGKYSWKFKTGCKKSSKWENVREKFIEAKNCREKI